MKRIDKLIISSFFGPFFLTFLVVVFILLTQHMLKYFDDIIGKDLDWAVLAQLLFYFAVFLTPVAMPLAVLLSSLMTFGNLGEHFELTAIKSAGISLLRALFPIFIFVLGLTVFAFYSNNYFVPKAALEAYSLLYDIKQKKPALDLKEGAFYNGIPDFSIKVEKKHDDGMTIEDIIMYDHRKIIGNKKVILADSGLMYTVNNDRYLKLELFHGNFYFEDYTEAAKSNSRSKETMSRSSFDRSEYVLDLSSFGMDRTDKSLFEGNRIMRNLSQLTNDVDSVGESIQDLKLKIFNEQQYAFFYHLRGDTIPLTSDLEKVMQAKLTEKAIQDSLNSDTVSVVSNESDTLEGEAETNLELKLANKKIVDTSRSKKPKRETSPYQKSKVSDRKTIPTKEKLETTAKTAELSITKKNKRPQRFNQKAQLTQSNKISSTKRPQRIIPKRAMKINDTLNHTQIMAYIDSIRGHEIELSKLQSTLNNVRQAKTKVQSHNTRLERLVGEQNIFEIQYHKILANSAACIIMFLIGAPLGAIIKRGGLGMPVLLSIIFFIIFYVLSMTGEKWAKQDIIDPMWGIWSANLILLPVGLFFLRQARNDIRLFEADFYNVMLERFKTWFSGKKVIEENIEQ